MNPYEQRLRNDPDLVLREASRYFNLHLDKNFAQQLDASVQSLYSQLWQEAQAADDLQEEPE